MREGFSRRDDSLPERFTREPLPSGPFKGSVVELDLMLREYYSIRGWDPETASPLPETLERLGLPPRASPFRTRPAGI